MSQSDAASSTPAAPQTSSDTQTATATRPEYKAPVPWNVVLIDDDEHSYEYVIRMAQQLFKCSPERAYAIAKTVDTDGRAVCMTTHKELAELKVEQITSFGADPLMAISKGAMTAIIEPAEFGGEDDASDHTRDEDTGKGKA